MIVGYVRCSTEEQHEDRQVEALKMRSVERIFMDKLSGKNADRPQLQAMLEFVRDGDTVICESISRLARSTRDLLSLVDRLNAKHVAFVSLKESLDTTTPSGRFVLTIFAALAELERENILQRQAEGIAIAKAKGVYKGRVPVKIDRNLLNREIAKWNNGQQTAVQTAKNLGISKSTLYRINRKGY